MNTTNNLRRTLNFVLASLLAALASLPVFGAEANSRQTPANVETVNVIQTSFVPRVITNVIEVRVPTNVFVNVYRTNQFTALRTNVLDVYRTNWVTATLTNTIPVRLTQTNLVTRYQTNVNTLTLTNWETVLVFKTNRFTQPITNLVQIDVPAGKSETTPPADNVEAKGDNTTTASTAASTDGLLLDAKRTAKPSANGQAEIILKLKSAGDETPNFSSQEWKVERTDGSVLLFGRGPEFKRDVPLGTYKVEVKARSTENSPLVRVRGNFEVTRDEVVQAKPAGLVNARKCALCPRPYLVEAGTPAFCSCGGFIM